MNKKRIVSLSPSATEILCALGLSDLLVGVSYGCNCSEEMRQLPKCTSPEINISNGVKALYNHDAHNNSEELPFFHLNEDLICSLNPDIVLTQSQSNFYTVSLEKVTEFLNTKLSSQTELIVIQANVFENIYQDIHQIANALGFDCSDYVEELNDRINLIKHKIKFINPSSKILCLEWMNPLIESGNWIPDLLKITKSTSIQSVSGEPSKKINWDDVIAHNPDMIIFMICDHSISKSMSEINSVISLPNYKNLKAVLNNEIYVVDGSKYFNLYGPKLIDSAEILAEIIYPKQFNFGFQNNAWNKFET